MTRVSVDPFMSYLDELRAAIRRAHDCDAEHVESVPVREDFQGRTLWQGRVEVFDLQGHARARRCYAWAHAEEDETDADYVTVLAVPPVDSPQDAVKAALLREVREEREDRAASK